MSFSFDPKQLHPFYVTQSLRFRYGKVARARRVGSGPFGAYGISPASIAPAMHGQQAGRLAVLIMAVGMAIWSTGASTPSANGQPLDSRTIAYSVATPRL